MNLSLPTSLPVAHNYDCNSSFYQLTTRAVLNVPENHTFIARNRKTPCQVTDYNVINFLNEFWSPPVTLGYNKLPLSQNVLQNHFRLCRTGLDITCWDEKG